MIMLRQIQWAALTVLMYQVAMAGSARARSREQVLRNAKVDMTKAVDVAVTKVPNATLTEIDLERTKTGRVWELDLLTTDTLMKVQVDPVTGNVIKVWDASKDEPGEVDEARQAAASVKVEWRAALATALKTHAGATPYCIELEVEDGAVVYAVHALAGGRRVDVAVDAASGQPLERRDVEKDDEDAEGAERQGEVDGEDQESDVRHPADARFTDSFDVESSEFTSTGRNPYFILEPGYQRVLTGKEGRHAVRLEVTVLNETRRVGDIDTRVVEERETKDGALAEVSHNYFAICKRTNDVFYFGETTDEYRDGKIVGHEGAWEAGKNHARAGLMMPGTPLVGARFYQEIAPGQAMDRAEIISLTETLQTPAGTFVGCQKVEETTPLESGEREYKIYAPGVGLIRDGSLVLAAIKRP